MENDKGFEDISKRWLRRMELLTAMILIIAVFIIMGGK